MNLNSLPRWCLGAVLGGAIGSFYVLEQQWTQVGLWLFLVVSLTLGMGHGALDIVLLIKQFKPRSNAAVVSLLYLAFTLLCGWVLSHSFSWALISLLLMSVWHFGEIYGERLWLRLATGGASVMTPVLLQGTALSELLRGVAGSGFHWLLGVWSALAWAWAGLVCVIACGSLTREPSVSLFGVDADQIKTRALLEVSVVLILGFFLSPLLQFALYFGFYHCTTHIARVLQAMARDEDAFGRQMVGAWIASGVLTALLMVALWQWLPLAGAWAHHADSQVLQWLVVALASVTAPHLLLVGYSQRWLSR